MDRTGIIDATLTRSTNRHVIIPERKLLLITETFPIWLDVTIVLPPMGPAFSARCATAVDLCEVCSELNIPRITHPLLPCHNPLSCSTPPGDREHVMLGTVDEIKSRRSICKICRLIAECLDKEPSDADGECRMKEYAQFCNFKLPENIELQDTTITHFHLTQTSVIFDPSTADNLQGPSFPWEMRERAQKVSHYILGLQARSAKTRGQGAAYPQTEKQLLKSIGGRHVGPQVNAQLIRRWLHDCESKHGEPCQHFLQLPGGRDKAPTFVVDVIESCLVDTPSQCRYVALSYVWGKAPVFRHLLENSQELRKPNSLRSFPIPATIRDAITLVHAIGERYLWVDSICITQNDLKMQQTEIMRMGSIYSNALFTIIAAAGDHANSGLPGVRPGSREQLQKVLKIGDSELLTVIDVRKGDKSGIDDTVWAQRAWTFQERLLSSRLLVFSENQVYWSCRVVTHSEERALEDVEDILRLHLPFPERSTRDLSREFLQPYEYCHLYDDLLSSYRERHLTYQSDILNAFNGVTEVLGAIQNDTFLWGLPESQFSRAIIWDTFGSRARNHIEVPIFKSDGSQEMVPIPSWSWAAWGADEWVHLPDLEDMAHNIVQPAIRFHLVDNERRLVWIKEQPSQDDADSQMHTSWRPSVQTHTPQFIPEDSPSQIGQLHFWTSHANVRVVRTWVMGGRAAGYALLLSPDEQPDLKDTTDRVEIVYQDFIVVATCGKDLILLAIEWKDGIAYRVGKAKFRETQWAQVKNRQWRLITLG